MTKLLQIQREQLKVLTEKVLVATYTAGYPIEQFKEKYINFVDSLLPVCRAIQAISKWFGRFLLAFC